jgi:predicted ribosome quality control (RQC) complex YloA/Tae2 family protein
MALREMNNLDYRFLVEELKALWGARLVGIYETSKRAFRFKFSKEKQEFNLVVELGLRANVTKYVEPSPAKPTQFASILRNGLENRRLETMEQLNFDRVLKMSFEGRDEPSLVIEMFREGNMLLCSSGRITAAYEEGAYAARVIKPGEEYVTPPVAKTQPDEFSLEHFAGMKGPVVSALARAVNLAPFYLEEACSRAGVEYKRESAGLSESEKTRLVEEIRGLLDVSRINPTLYLLGTRVENYAPVAMEKLSALQGEKRASFGEVLDEYYRAKKTSSDAERVQQEIQGKRMRLERTLETQRAALAEFERKTAEAREFGDSLYANHALVSEALELARGLKDKRLSNSEVESKADGLLKGRAKVKFSGRAVKIELP